MPYVPCYGHFRHVDTVTFGIEVRFNGDGIMADTGLRAKSILAATPLDPGIIDGGNTAFLVKRPLFGGAGMLVKIYKREYHQCSRDASLRLNGALIRVARGEQHCCIGPFQTRKVSL